MHFDGFNSIEGRHLVFAYAAVFLLQSGYLGWVLYQWGRLAPEKITTKAL